MNDLLDPQQRDVVTKVRQFLQEKCPPEVIREHDRTEVPPLDIREHMKQLDIYGYTIPKEYGGNGIQLTLAALVVEEISRVWPTLAWIYIGTAFYGGSNLVNLGTPEQKETFLPALAKGDLVFAYALTEPDSGSDATAARVRAIRENGDFVISGTKTFISLADKADWLITLTRTDPDAPQRSGLSMFLVPQGLEGLRYNKIPKLGYRGSTLCEVFYDNVRVPAENLLGGPDMLHQGMPQLLKTLDIEHLEIAACGVGVAQGAFDLALSYARTHQRDGAPMMKSQSITHCLAEMATQVHASRLILYNACRLLENGQPASMEATMAKYHAAETAKLCATQAMQLCGDRGHETELEVQRMYRDSLVLSIGGGTSQVLKNMIAGHLRRG